MSHLHDILFEFYPWIYSRVQFPVSRCSDEILYDTKSRSLQDLLGNIFIPRGSWNDQEVCHWKSPPFPPIVLPFLSYTEPELVYCYDNCRDAWDDWPHRYRIKPKLGFFGGDHRDLGVVDWDWVASHPTTHSKQQDKEMHHMNMKNRFLFEAEPTASLAIGIMTRSLHKDG